MVLVSAVIPVYNQERYLAEAVDSVLGQTFRDVELIVVNDGSTDRSPQIIASYGSRVRAVHKPNGGNASALNLGIREARGPWIAWLSSDDLWEPTKLARQVSLLEREPSADLIYTGHYVIDPDGRVLERATPPLPSTPREFMVRLARACFVNGSSVLVRRQVFEEIGFFNEKDRLTSDYDLWLRMAPRYNFRGIPDPLVRYRVHPGQLSRNREALERSRKRVASRGCHRLGSVAGATSAVLRLWDEARLAPWLIRTSQSTPLGRARGLVETVQLFVNPDSP